MSKYAGKKRVVKAATKGKDRRKTISRMARPSPRQDNYLSRI